MSGGAGFGFALTFRRPPTGKVARVTARDPYRRFSRLSRRSQPAAETQVLSPYGEPMGRTPAASRKVRREQGGKRRPFLQLASRPRNRRRSTDRAALGESGVAAKCADASRLIALIDRLKFANIFVSESRSAVVHLAQGIQENRNVDVQTFILVFAWLEPAMKKSVLYTVYQIWDNALQPERKPLLAFLRRI